MCKTKQLTKGVSLYYKADYNIKLVEKIKDFFVEAKKDTDLKLIKENKKAKRKVYQLNWAGKTYYCKNYASRRKDKIIKNFFRKGKAVKSFKISASLLQAGIEVVPAEFALSYQPSALIYDSVFVSKELTANNLLEFILKHQADKKIRRLLAKKLGKLWAKLNNNNFFHKDAALWNFLVKDKELMLVDVDDIYNYPILPKLWQIKNLARFNASLLSHFSKEGIKLPSLKERALFFKEFDKYYQGSLQLKEFIAKINKQTLKRLEKRGQLDLAKEDKFLEVKN